MPHDIDDLDPGMASESCLPGRQRGVRKESPMVQRLVALSTHRRAGLAHAVVGSVGKTWCITGTGRPWSSRRVGVRPPLSRATERRVGPFRGIPSQSAPIWSWTDPSQPWVTGSRGSSDRSSAKGRSDRRRRGPVRSQADGPGKLQDHGPAQGRSIQ